MSSPRRNDDSREDLRFDLKEIQLSKGGSGSTDAPPPSTLYDPAVLAISPDYRAKVQARKDRFTEGQDEPDSEDTPIHIPSPFPNPKRSVEIPVGQSKITMFDEDTDIGDEDPEMELCCHGYIPLYPTLVAINLFNIVRFHYDL